MKKHKKILMVLIFFFLFFSVIQAVSFAACDPPAVIAGESYTYVPTSVQNAYDFATSAAPSGLGLASFTLRLPAEIIYESLTLDGGSVVLDGGYECDYITRTSNPTGIFGTLTVTTGTANFAGNIAVVSTDQCSFDNDNDGFFAGSCAPLPIDCNDADPNINPGALEICDGLDNNCDGQVDEGVAPTDGDGDGYFGSSCGFVADDCNDLDPLIYPGALDVPYDGIDQDCNGVDLIFAEQNNCSLCHDPANTWTDLHLITTAPDGTCVACHAATVSNILPGHYGDTVRTAGNNMNAGQVIVCASCHDQQSFEHNFGDNIVWPKIAAVYPNQTCDTCHEDRASRHATDNAHNNRVIDVNCNGCHTSDNSVLGSPGTGTLVSDADVDSLHGTCAACHSYTGTLVNAALVRQSIQQGLNGTQITCNDCHEKDVNHGDHEHPVEVGPNDLSYESPGTLCGECHVVANWTEIETIEHNVPTNGVGSCATCHNSSRQEVQDAIALAADPTYCLACHSDKEFAPHGSPDHVAENYVTGGLTSCVTCHDPGTEANATVSIIHNNNCSLCHAAGLALQPGLPLGGGVCTDCHTDAWETTHSVNTPSHNALVQTGASGCGACHDDPPPLVDVDPINANDPKLHDACSSCHNSEGGLVGLAFGKDFETGGTCATCHTDTWEVIHTTAPDHAALVNVATTSCGNCHSDPPPLVDPVDPTVHDECVSCHDVNSGAPINLATGKTFAVGGNCTTCHTASFDTVHPDTIDHSALVKVAATSCGDCHSDPPPLVDPADNKVHNACASCHDSEGGLINLATGQNFDPPGGDCTTCHTDPFVVVHPVDVDHSQPIQLSNDCAGCHSAPPPLVDPNDPTVHDECISCHNSEGGLINLAAGNPSPNECITCHGNDLASLHPNLSANHAATLGTEFVVVFEAGTHDSSMVGHGGVTVDCNTCHSTQLASVHDNNCALCHSGNPSPYDDGIPWIQGYGCSNSACHTTYHADVTPSHWTVEDQCTVCHGGSFQDFPPLPTSCANCHASYSPADTEAPVTTSDVLPEYAEPATIEFSMTDGGKVGVGTFYHRVDGGPVQTGSSIKVYSVGVHSLEFWGVDQAGNEELPHNNASFEIVPDDEPPVTTSNAVANYYYPFPANISLTATDNNTSSGVVATYYTLNGGPVQAGTHVSIGPLADTTSYNLQFWSEDWNGNVESPNTVNFTVYGYATLRLVWGNSDVTGSPCASYPGAAVGWTVQLGTSVIASGIDGCPDWSGVNDVLVSSGRTYSVTLDWYLDGGSIIEDQTYIPTVAVPNSGDVIKLP